MRPAITGGHLLTCSSHSRSWYLEQPTVMLLHAKSAMCGKDTVHSHVYSQILAPLHPGMAFAFVHEASTHRVCFQCT